MGIANDHSCHPVNQPKSPEALHFTLQISMLQSALRRLGPFRSALPIGRPRLMSTTTLDRNVFSPFLYKQITDTWLADINLTGKYLPENVAARWFRSNADLDRICNEKFAHTLEAIGPDILPHPTAEPFIEELRLMANEDLRESDGSQVAWTALSMVILLDQIPRNIFRTGEGLTNVYTHYDKMAFEFVKTLLSPASPIPRPDLHPQWRNSFAHRMWFYLPLEHSEDVKQHDELDRIVEQFLSEISQTEGLEATRKLVEGFTLAEKMHRDLLVKFGRYPHRNTALGRGMTQQEEEFLRQGGATFGVKS